MAQICQMGLHLKDEKTHLTHTLQHMQGQVSLDFLSFHLRQEESGTERSRQNAATSPEQVIVKLNPLIAGFSAYYAGLVEPAILSRYNSLLEQRLLTWASGIWT